MKKHVKGFDEYITEGKLDKKPFEPKFAYKAATLAAYIRDQIESIAADLALEKHLRDPKNYQEPEVTEVDRSRALQLIFHKEWKKKLAEGRGDEFVLNARNKAEKKDTQARKKNDATILKLRTGEFIGKSDSDEKIEG